MGLLTLTKGDKINFIVFLIGFGLYYTQIPIIRNIGGFLLGGSAIAYTIREVRKGKAEGKEVF